MSKHIISNSYYQIHEKKPELSRHYQVAFFSILLKNGDLKIRQKVNRRNTHTTRGHAQLQKNQSQTELGGAKNLSMR